MRPAVRKGFFIACGIIAILFAAPILAKLFDVVFKLVVK
jgi:hypothetical protein